MHFKKITVGAAIMSAVLSASIMTVFGTTGVVLSEGNIDTVEILSIEEVYGEETLTMENQSITVDWEDLAPYVTNHKAKAADSISVKDYKYVCNGKVPPNELIITSKKNGYTYKGTVRRTDYIYNSKLDKYTGYYSGTLYRQ